MEKECGGKFIPVKQKADGSYTKESKLVMSAEFDNLRKFSYSLLAETAESLINGKVEASPLAEGKSLPCEYCDYSAVCGNYPPENPRSYAENSAELIKGIMDGTIVI